MLNPEEAKLGTACAWIAGDLRRERDDRLARLGSSERFHAANASRQSRWTGASLLPGTKRAFYHPVLTRMITDQRKGPVGRQRVPEDRQRLLQTAELVVDRNPDPLEDPGEVPGSAAWSQDRSNRVDHMVTGGELL